MRPFNCAEHQGESVLMKNMRILAAGFAMTLVSLLAYAAGPAGKPEGGKPPGIDAIRAYEGSWEVSVEHFDTAHSKASKEKSLLRNDCWKSGGYFACDQYVNGESKALLVFTYDAAKNMYASYPIPSDGSAAGLGKLLIEGNVWTFPWESREGDKTTYFRVVNVFATPDQIESRQEFSTDNVHWTLMARGLDKKTGDK
jgi:hypothetical protein